MKKDTPRELTEKEKIRVEKVSTMVAEMEAKGFRKTELLITPKKAQLFSILVWLVFTLLFTLLYMTRNKLSLHMSFKETVIFILVVVVLIVVHELIHGLTWMCFVKDRKSIEFGFVPRHLMPYCTCTEPATKGQYALAVFMPCLVLGLIPATVSIFIGSYFLLSIGLFMILGASGDLVILLKVLTYKSSAREQFLLDHPTECGCLVFEKIER